MWKVSEIYEPEETRSHSVKEWSEEDRPRERLMKHGAETLSTAELLAILIGSGNTEESAVDLTKRILKDCKNNLSLLSKMSLSQLMTYKGIGEAKAITIMAACELGRRREKETPFTRPLMDSPQKLYEHLWPLMRDLDVEESYLIMMNQGLRLIDTVKLSHGGITETSMDVRLIIKHALLNNATVIAIAHNHPSGTAKPSRDDDMITKKVKEACTTMRIHLSDHMIITDGDYYSYNENGRL
ncbi:MAG: DNA repair protein RadC [Prevotella sp.]|nr:DNA repair protein RadC [Candidatus Prevotella equi]